MSAGPDAVPPPRAVPASLAAYGAAHALVDATCAGMLLTLWQREILTAEETGWYFLLYNFLAFAAQPLLGLVMDRARRPRAWAIAGCVLTGLAALEAPRSPIPCIVLAGLGNSLFHLGAGTVCLNLTPGRAAAPGIFVAPGAAGLLLGTWLGKAGAFEPWRFVMLLAIACGGMLSLPAPSVDYRRELAAGPSRGFWPVLLLLLVCIGVRSLVGAGMVFPWKSGLPLSIALTAFVVLGKGLGGVAADRLGWIRVAVGALALAAPLLAFGARVPQAAIAGMFLINVPMGITLAATANLLPGRPAFAFGLNCLALEAGTWLLTLPPGGGRSLGDGWVVFAGVFASAALLYLALRTAFHRLPGLYARVRP